MLQVLSRSRAVVFAGFAIATLATSAVAQSTNFKQFLAEAAAADPDIAAFYQQNGYKPIWTSNNSRARRAALFEAIESAPEHGLPEPRYKEDHLVNLLKNAKTERDQAKAEYEFSKVFLTYSTDLQTGVLVPRKVDSGIVREVPYRNRTSYLTNFAKSNPKGFLRALPPTSDTYAGLMKEKLRFEKIIGAGGWGDPVKSKALKPGQSGNSVVALRNRLIAMGYLGRSNAATYDAEMQKAVAVFQQDHGLNPDGVAGAGTLAQINMSPEERLQSIIVAMERERWINQPLGKRHVMVNITDFTAKIIDNGKVTFQTRSVVGANDSDRRTPEFSDVMELMVINPTWNVPRSIAVKEYLPMLKKNPNAVGHLNILDARGKKVSRSSINFANYTEATFPYDLKQPPSRDNALGLVKFLFPNKYNIYLHDTPSKSLFAREKRAFSHGCIRLADPFDFAYAILAPQSADPEAEFKAHLKTKRETAIALKDPVPVHLDYRTAVPVAKGRINFREDVYGRDAKIWNALAKEGVVLRAVKG